MSTELERILSERLRAAAPQPPDLPNLTDAVARRIQRRRTTRLTGLAAVVTAAVIAPTLILAGHGGSPSIPSRTHAPSPSTRPGAIATPTDEPTGWSVTYPIALPGRYGTPTGLAVDSITHDVWFFAQGPDQRLFHWSQSQGKITDSYRIDNADRAMAAGEFTPITIDAAHRGWLGINQTVLVFTPGKGEPVREIKLPAVTIGRAGSGLPHPGGPDFGRHASITAIAAGPGGTIATSRTFATELQTIDTSTYTVGTIPLPHGTAVASLGAGDLASSPTGNDVAVALYSSDRKAELGQLVNATWTIGSPCGADSVTVAHRIIAVAGDGCVATGHLPTTDTPAATATASITGLPEKPAVAAVSDQTIVVTVPGGLVAATGSTQTPLISLGQTVAGPSLGGDHSADPNRLVPVRPELMRSGPTGMVYFVPANRSEIGLVQHTP